MATNWNMKEATKAILSGDKEAMVDIGRRFPLAAIAIAQMGNNPGALTIINALPDHISVRKIESVLKDGVQESSDDDVEEVMPKPEEPKTSGRGKKKVEKEEPVKAKGKKASAKKNDEDDLESMSEVELFRLCKKKGIKAAPKQDKEYYIDLLTPADSDEEEDKDWEDEEEKPVKKNAKKSKKNEDTDEDEDWDI